MNFIKETLPPNSLEVLVLQENPAHKDIWVSEVTVDTIFKGCIKRHKSSLKKLLVDANCNSQTYESDKWRFDRDVLNFITSGKMGNLRELGFAVDYKDWVSLLLAYFYSKIIERRTRNKRNKKRIFN
jgi:hypothetical protein